MSSRQQRQEDQMGQNDDPPSPDIITTFEDIEDDLIDYEQLPGYRVLQGVILLPDIRNRADDQENLHSQQPTALTNASEPLTNFEIANELCSNWQRERENNVVSSDTRQSHLMGRARVLETDQFTASNNQNNTLLSDTYLPDIQNQEPQTVVFDEITDNENLTENQILDNINNRGMHPAETTSRENLSLCQSSVHMASAAEQTTDSLNFQYHAEESNNSRQSADLYCGKEASSASNSRVNRITYSTPSPSSYFEQTCRQSQEPPHTPQLSEMTDSSSAGGSSNLPQKSRGNDFESNRHPINDVLTLDGSSPSLTIATVTDKMPSGNHKEVPLNAPNLAVTNASDKKLPSKNQRLSNYHPLNWPATDAANSLIPSSPTSTETTVMASDHQNDMLNYNTRKRPATHAPTVDSLTTLDSAMLKDDISEHQEDDPDCGDESQVHPHKKARTTNDPNANPSPSNGKM